MNGEQVEFYESTLLVYIKLTIIMLLHFLYVGDAFKEAHGGGGLTGFIELLSTALFILNGGPKPAFWDALLPISGESLNFGANDGWRNVVADGVNELPSEIFVSQNRFKVLSGKEIDFENRWKNRDSKLSECPGFVGFVMQRRDATRADDGYNYVASTIWKDRSAFEAWRASPQFQAGHKDAKPTSGSESGSESAPKGPPPSIFDGPPKLAFYEGKLTLSSPEGL